MNRAAISKFGHIDYGHDHMDTDETSSLSIDSLQTQLTAEISRAQSAEASIQASIPSSDTGLVVGDTLEYKTTTVTWDSTKSSQDITISGASVSKSSNSLRSYVYSTDALIPDLYNYNITIAHKSSSGSNVFVMLCEKQFLSQSDMNNHRSNTNPSWGTAVDFGLVNGGSGLTMTYNTTANSTGSINYSSSTYTTYAGNNSTLKIETRNGVIDFYINDVKDNGVATSNIRLDLDKTYYIAVIDNNLTPGAFDIGIQYTALQNTLNKNLTFMSETPRLVRYHNNIKYDYSLPDFIGELGVRHRFSFNPNIDNKPFFVDEYCTFGWDSPGNDIEYYLRTAPSTGGVTCLAVVGSNNVLSTYISQTNLKYDVYPNGLTSGEVATFYVSAENDSTYPIYKLKVLRLTSTVNAYVERIS